MRSIVSAIFGFYQIWNIGFRLITKKIVEIKKNKNTKHKMNIKIIEAITKFNITPLTKSPKRVVIFIVLLVVHIIDMRPSTI